MNDDNYMDYFICPHCGSNELVERQEAADLEAEVVGLYDSLATQYENVEIEYGVIAHWRCLTCGQEIIGPDGEIIDTEDDLIVWIKNGCRRHELNNEEDEFEDEDFNDHEDVTEVYVN